MSSREINPVALHRAKRGLSVEALAEKSKVGKATITRIENWKVTPELRTLVRLANALEIEIDEIAWLANLPKTLPVTTFSSTGRQDATAGAGTLAAAHQL